MHYIIQEIDGVDHAREIHQFNSLEPGIFPPLETHHLQDGFWWLAYDDDGGPVGFAGMVSMRPFRNIGYLKRAYVLPEHRGHGLQFRLMFVREVKARQLGWTQLVSECAADSFSAKNFMRAGFERCEPEQVWGAAGSIYFSKALS